MIGFQRLLKQFIGRALLRQKLRALVAILGVALGVAVMVAIRLANVSVIESFRAAVDSVSTGVSLRVFPQAGPFPEERLRELHWLQNHGQVSPVLENYAMVISPDSPQPDDELLARNELLYVLGVDILRDLPVRRYQLLQLDQEGEQPVARDLLRLLVDDDAIILTEQFARRTGYRLGETITLAFGSREQELKIRGFLRDEGPARTLQGNFAIMDLAAAQLVSGRLGELDYLDLQLESEGRIEAARQAIAERLPANLMVEEPRDQAGRTETMIAAFQFNLTALSSVALLVGLFLIYNMVSVSVAARRSEIGMLRALGAGRPTIMGLFLGEAVVLAVLGLIMGLPLGTWLAQSAVIATSQTVETFYIATIAESTARETALSWRDGFAFSGATLLLALLAALLPAWNAATTDPIQVIRGQAPPSSLARRRRWLGKLALLLLLAGWGLTRLPPVNGQPIFGFLAELLFMLAAACCAPIVLDLCCRFARRILARWSPAWRLEWKLASANLQAGIPQTSVSVAALSMSLGMMISIGIMVGSFRQTVSYWLDSVLTADIVVKPIMNSSALLTGSIDPEILEIIENDPEVLATCWYSSRQIPYDSGAIRLDTTELKPFLTHGRILFKTPGPVREKIFQALEQSSDFVLVSESFSLRYRKQAGDSITLPTPTGPRTKTILGVYFDYASNQGTILLDFAQYQRDFQDTSVARAPLGVSLHLKPDADPEATRRRLLDQLGPHRSVYVVTNDRVRQEALRIFESTFAITYVLQSIAILIAGTSVITTLVRLIHERQQEIGLLSLVGASRRQIQTMIVLEATMIGAVSQLLGIAVGILLSIVLIFVINVQSFGWTIQFHLPLLFLLQSTVAIVLAAALFGLYPARKAAGMDLRRCLGCLAFGLGVVLTLGCDTGRPPLPDDPKTEWLRPARPDQEGVRSGSSGTVREAGSEEEGVTDSWTKVLEPRPMDFPRDHGVHPDFQIEWWYFTGNLWTAEGRRFGYQLTFFRTGIQREPTNPSRWTVRDLYTAHFAISDVQGRELRQFERSSRAGIDWAGADEVPGRVWNGDWQWILDGDHHRLEAREGGDAIRLDLRPRKAPAVHDQQGLSRKGAEPGNASYYYSLTRLETDGQIELDGVTYEVTGLSWMDHEFSSSFLEKGQLGWDWFSIQFDHDQELMVYQIRRDSGEADPFSSGTLVAPDGSLTVLQVDDYKLTPLRHWNSPTSSGRYPIAWRLEIPAQQLDLEVRATFPSQEMDTRESTGIIYWEGTIDVMGSHGEAAVRGTGYLEMTGYAQSDLGGLLERD